ncbi:MAG: F0F1 ATP synthase subunit A [Robiginitalea sp.]
MQKSFVRKLLAATLLCLGPVLFAKESAPEAEGPEGTKAEIKEYIEHHLQDSHSFNIASYTDEQGDEVHWGFPLPVIIWDNGLKVFSSSRFHHGETVAEVGGAHYTLYHNKIYKTDAEGTIELDAEDHPANVKPLDLSITKNVVVMFLTGLLLLWIFTSMARNYARHGGIPKGAAKFFEPIVLYIRDEIAIPNIGEKKYRRYMPYLLTIFFFIWFLNMLGLTPLGINVTGNIAVTTALAVFTFLITNFTGTRDYWKHIFDPLGDAMPWYGKGIIYIILVPIELLGLFIKPFALLIRLYANMTAGHVVMMSLIGLIFIFKSWLGGPLSFGLSFAISLIELFVALLQAYIFTMLSALYFGFASEEHDHQHDSEEPVLEHL